MKSSPLRLRWVTYPTASYDLVEDFEGDRNEPIAADIDAEVKFNLGGEHYVFLRVSSKDGDAAPYRFSVTAVAGFEFDLDIARREYKPSSSPALVPVIAVNVARIVYAGAREFIAMMTSRATFGAAVLDSVLLEPRDVRINNSDLNPVDLVRAVFMATDQEIADLEARMKVVTEAREVGEAQLETGRKASLKPKKMRSK